MAATAALLSQNNDNDSGDNNNENKINNNNNTVSKLTCRLTINETNKKTKNKKGTGNKK